MPVIPRVNKLSLEEIKVLRLEQTMHIFRNNITKTSTQPSYCISAITSDHILSYAHILYPKTSIILDLPSELPRARLAQLRMTIKSQTVER